MTKDSIKSDELKYMINAARYLSMDYDEQYNEMDWFARWDLPEEIGLEWVDAKGIICSKELAQAISSESLQLLVKILNNFECAFESPMKTDVWTTDAMRTHPFWEEQRKLAKRFLITVNV